MALSMVTKLEAKRETGGAARARACSWTGGEARLCGWNNLPPMISVQSGVDVRRALPTYHLQVAAFVLPQLSAQKHSECLENLLEDCNELPAISSTQNNL